MDSGEHMSAKEVLTGIYETLTEGASDQQKLSRISLLVAEFNPLEYGPGLGYSEEYLAQHARDNTTYGQDEKAKIMADVLAGKARLV